MCGNQAEHVTRAFRSDHRADRPVKTAARHTANGVISANGRQLYFKIDNGDVVFGLHSCSPRDEVVLVHKGVAFAPLLPLASDLAKTDPKIEHPLTLVKS